jgi:hypothetical protein
MYAVRSNTGNFIQTRQARVNFQPLAKTLRKCSLYEWDEVGH